ncbi:MAG: hypothetical protein M1833_001864 [Piccolia ochrophora]|nr:MAG: hypothetical protein M1833_001864 [Piccolia ochrophora]
MGAYHVFSFLVKEQIHYGKFPLYDTIGLKSAHYKAIRDREAQKAEDDDGIDQPHQRCWHLTSEPEWAYA